MIAVGNVHECQPLHNRLVAMIEILQTVQVFEIPFDRCFFAVDLEGIERLVAAGIPRRLEQSKRAVVKAAQEAQASSMPTGSTLPVKLCLRSLINVSVIADTELIEPFSQRAVSMQWANRSPVTPEPAAATSSRQRPVPPCGKSAEIVQSCRKLAR